MEQTRITQCPKCDTTFRITPAQLKVAKGAVRCGACLNVFRAAEHFQQIDVEDEPKLKDDRTQDLFSDERENPSEHNISDEHPTSDESELPSEANASNETEALIDDGDALIDDSGYVDKAPNTPPEEDFQFTPPVQNDVSNIDLGDLIDDSGYIDDDFLIDDDNGLIDDEKSEKKEVEFNEDFLSLDTEDKSGEVYSHKNDLQVTVGQKENEDESWARALLDDDDDDNEFAAEPVPIKEEVKKSEPIAKPVKKAIFTEQDINGSFAQFEEAPLDLSLPERQKRHKAVLLSIACLLMVGGLIAQAAFFNFDQWARQDSYRPFYKVACQALACTLPSSYDISRIRTTASPQVSSHPKFKNALMIDVLFMNEAEFKQSFPKLELTFSNANGKVVAHRLFAPYEYLAGEASGLTMMPIQTPIHIALEIADPGHDANNYQVRFLAP